MLCVAGNRVATKWFVMLNVSLAWPTVSSRFKVPASSRNAAAWSDVTMSVTHGDNVGGTVLKFTSIHLRNKK